MTCPECKSMSCRRSRRHGFRDGVLSLLGMKPWRCLVCNERFSARRTPLSLLHYVHCSECGSISVQKIPGLRVDEDRLGALKRAAGVAAYRCARCRRRFFSMRIFYRPESQEEART
jgi:DNA-directed RNA polymerase subunit RPC12/RpoP